MHDLKHFHKLFYFKKDKVYQDNFILKHLKTSPIKRRRPKTGTYRVRNAQAKYFVTTPTKKLVPVCLKSFINILGISRFRVNRISKQFHDLGKLPIERRGGNRKEKLFNDKKTSVINFISKYNVIETHYCRSKSSGRNYLPSDLSINKMYKHYCNEISDNELKVKSSYFRTVFNKNFNLGFGTPRTDVCSTCLELDEQLKTTTDQKQKQLIIMKKRVHKLRAKAFYSLTKEKDNKLLIISFDCQKNLPLPKLPDQSTYYSRQIYLFNLTVVKGPSGDRLIPETVTSYCWTENNHQKGSNEIASCVFDTLQSLDMSAFNTVRLVCDGCGGQNKNSTMVAMCCYWFSLAPRNIKKIELTFPVTGHSFLPPDRVFAFTEKAIKKMEVIVTPEEYMNVMKSKATIKSLRDVQIFYWKEAKDEVMKPVSNWHFKIQSCKRVFLTKGKTNSDSILAQGETTYRNLLGVPKSLMKRGKTIRQLKLEVVPINQVAMKEEKLRNVRDLLRKHYGDNWKALNNLKFYMDILDDPREDTVEREEDVCEFVEELPEFRI